MTNYIAQYEQKNITELTKDKEIPEFQAGDTVRVSIKVIDGNNTRLQAYEGVVIARENKGIASSFIVRKISHGEGVERKFMIYSPIVEKITVVKKGIVRRAKLYYLRNLRGKAARIQERITFKPSSKKKIAAKDKQTEVTTPNTGISDDKIVKTINDNEKKVATKSIIDSKSATDKGDIKPESKETDNKSKNDQPKPKESSKK